MSEFIDLARAVEFVNAGAGQPAVIHAQRHLASHPDDPSGYVALALALELTGADNALETARRAVALAPDFPQGWLTLSQMLHRAGKDRDAEDAASRAIQLQPNVWQCHQALAQALPSWANERAIREAKEAVRLAPDLPGPHCTRTRMWRTCSRPMPMPARLWRMRRTTVHVGTGRPGRGQHRLSPRHSWRPAMATWDVSASGVSDVLTRTGDAAQTIGTALSGSPDGVSKGVGDVASQIGMQAQSGLIGTALQGFFDDRQVVMASIMDRIDGVIEGTADAVNAVIAGDRAMAGAIGSLMSQACASSDFTSFLPPQG